MAVTAPRATPEKISPFSWKHDYVVASGQTLYHGQIGGVNASGLAAGPAAGVRLLGRVSCANGVSAGPGEKVRIDQGCFRWANGATLTAADVAAQVLLYASDNETVTDTPTNEPFGILVEVDANGAWVLSGLGVGTLEIGS